ncbi:MAG: TRAP transporter small permease [Casimicrobiaceae bacterium]
MPDTPTPRGPLAASILALGSGAAWLFVVAAGITVWEVMMRYVFGAPTTWAHVLTTALCAVGFALGGAYSMVRDEHIRITSMVDHFTPRLRFACELLAVACGVIYLAALSYAATLQAWEAVWHFEGLRWRPESVPGPPYWPLPALTRVALAVGAVLFLLALIRHLFHVVLRRR